MHCCVPGMAHLDSMEPDISRRFGRATARYGVLQSEATIAWIEEVEALVESEATRVTDDPPVSAETQPAQ